MDSTYFKKCLVCSVENKEKDIRCKNCSGKLSDVQRILIEAKALRDKHERSKNALQITLGAPVVVFLAISLILVIIKQFGADIVPIHYINAMIAATIFVGAGHLYSKRYLPAFFFALLIPLSIGLFKATYFDIEEPLTFTMIIMDNGLNYGMITLIFIYIEIWLLVAKDASKWQFELKKAPCQVACPAGIDIPHYIALISEGKYDAALNLIREQNPLPAVVGRVCPHPCEQVCYRGVDGEPIAINPLKRFVSDYERKIEGIKPDLEVLNKKNEKVAIIGSGPAGLSAAYFLARLGVGSTIFEKLEVAGGMLAVGIPKYRLPREVLNFEIDIIKDLGVEIETNSKIGTDSKSITSLLEKGYDAVLIAAGVQSGMKLHISGEDKKGVYDCLTFLEEASLKEKVVIGSKAVVIGGGNAAIDSARTLVRLGAESVTVLYRRSAKEMPASPHEVAAAEEEGVVIEYLSAPVKIITESDIVTAIECVKMELGEPDSSGRRRPIPIDNSEFKIDADTVIAAIGQGIDPDFIRYDEKINLTAKRLLKVDEGTYKTSMERVYSAGDCVSGPSTVIHAIAHGKKAALSIFYDLYKDKIKWPNYKDNYIKKCEIIEPQKAMKKLRVNMPSLLSRERICSFDAVEKGYSEGMALEESLRCLKCHQELIE